MFDFRRITLFCLEKRLSKHKMAVFSKNFLGGHGPFGPPGYDYGSNTDLHRIVEAARSWRRRMRDAPQTGCALRIASIYVCGANWKQEQAWRVISIVACCHCVPLPLGLCDRNKMVL